MVYIVTIGGSNDNATTMQESTIAGAKALVSGLNSIFTIHYAKNDMDGKRVLIGMVSDEFGILHPFTMGGNYSERWSKYFVQSFKRSRIEKDANNTTYVIAEEFLARKRKNKNAEKLLELCGF